MHHLRHGLSWTLFSPLTRTLLSYSILAQVRLEGLSSWRCREGAGEPSVAARQALPSLSCFSSWVFHHGWDPYLPCPFLEHPGSPGPGLLLCSSGTCPLHIFSAITPGALERSCHHPPSCCQDVHLQLSSRRLSLPSLKLGPGKLMAEGFRFCSDQHAGRAGRALLLCPCPVGQAAAVLPASSPLVSQWSEW